MEHLESINFTCDKHLSSIATLRSFYRRSHEDVLMISEDAAKQYNLQILEANLCVRKMNVTDHVLSANESILLATAAREPVRQIIVAMNTNTAFLGTNRANRFHYQKIGLEKITLRRNGLPIASTPFSTQGSKRLLFRTLSALDLLYCGLGVTLDTYQQHFIMCFEHTSTQQAAHDFLHSELTNCSVSRDLQVSNALTESLEIFGVYAHPMFSLQSTAKFQERSSNFDSLKKDEIQLQDLIQNCKHLK